MTLRSACLGMSLALLLAGCSDDEWLDQTPPPAKPEAPGPYAVGVTRLEVQSEGRSLPVEVWYPAGSGGRHEEYVLELGVIELAKTQSPLAARRDAELDPRGAPYPTIVFSHGSGGVRIQSLFLTEYLATHGFVVAAPDHVGNTFAEEVNKANALDAAEAARLRPKDVSTTLDAMLAESASGTLLAGAVDETRVGVAGHSFGGFTALRIAGASIDAEAVLAECNSEGGLVCKGWTDNGFPSSAMDSRFRAALAQAPGGAQAMYAGDRNGFANVGMPVMIQGGTSDVITPFEPEQKAPFESLPAPAALLGVQAGGHFTFSDMCLLVELIGLSVEEFDDGCGSANIPYTEAHLILQRYSTAFFQQQLLGVEMSTLLHDTTELGPGVASFQTK